jgi:hypothetical protein
MTRRPTGSGRQDVTELTELIEGVIMPPGEWTPEHAASYVTEAWQDAVESIVETGRRLIEAKEHVGHGNWLPTIKQLPFGEDTTQMLMKIARHPDLANTDHARYLPASWTTLHALTPLPPGEIAQRIRAGEITPELRRSKAQEWATVYVQAKQEMFNQYSAAVDGLTQALSSAQAYTPRPDTSLPDSYLPYDKFIERAEKLAEIARNWRSE